MVTAARIEGFHFGVGIADLRAPAASVIPG